LSARSKHVKNLLRLITLLLTIAGVALAIEYSQIRDGAKVDGRIIEKHRKTQGGGPYGDAYEIIIEYQAYGQLRRFTTSRAVWDTWGTLNTIGATVPVLYLKDGKAFVDRFSYLYPFTAILLVLSTTAIAALLWILVISKPRIETASSRIKRYRDVKNSRHQCLSSNRRLLLKRLNLWLLVAGGILGLLVIGILRSSLWLVIFSFVAFVLLRLAMGRILVCPYCGASLTKDLQEIEPRVVSRTNWLVVRDYLAKGIPVTCRNCGRSLDD